MSAPLGQQQLIDPPARRRLIVPVGRTSWWGVDPSVRRVAVAYATSDGRRGARTASFADLSGGARLSEIRAETRLLCAELLRVDEWPAPGVVWVEQPSGKQPNPQLSYATGVIMEAVFDATGAVVETVASSSWKKAACGRGDIYKPTKDRPGPYGVLLWAQANGYTGFSYDEADALGIAEAARREIALDAR